MERIFEKLGRYFDSHWRLAVLDMERGRWIVEPGPGGIGYLKAENANGRHILMQPADEAGYLLADDLSWPLIRRHHQLDGAWKPGRLVVETSPGNFQVWIRSDNPLTLTQKRCWLKRLMSDPGADPHNRWGRCPGFRNRKEKHRPPTGTYPLARLVWIDWARRAKIPEIAPEPSKSFSHQPPKGGVCRTIGHLSRSLYERGDESATDFAYTLALVRRGHGDESIRRLLLSQREQWKNHAGTAKKERYLERTIRRARQIVAKS